MEFKGALPSGTRFQDFEFHRVLGHGGFGITYLGWEFSLDIPVAIKEYMPVDIAFREADHSVCPKSESERENFEWGLDRFLDEARTLARFLHPNISRIYRFFRAHGTGYIVMEYVEGETLSERLKRVDRFDEATLKSVLYPLLDGLEQVHSANFLHRDIKPGNIVIREDGSPVLIDFGAARHAVGQKSRSITSVVTPGYAPIEQYSTRGNQGPWTDIYALGGVCYRAITGIIPADATDRLRDDPLIPAVEAGKGNASPDFLMAIDAALKVNEPERPQNIEQWRSIFAGTATPKWPTATNTSVGSAQNKNRLLPVWVSIVVIVAVALGFWAWQSGFLVGAETSTLPVIAPKDRPVAVSSDGASVTEPQSSNATGRQSDGSIKRAEPTEKPLATPAAPESYVIHITTVPAGATTEIKGVGAYHDNIELMPGDHRVKVSAPGFRSREFTIAVSRDKRSFVLELEADRYALTITTDPADATVKVLNITEKYQPGMLLPPGRYQVEVSKAGYKTKSQWLEIKDTEQIIAMALEAEIKEPVAGDTFRDCADCPNMVVIPAGTFVMGSPSSEAYRAADEGPQHTVNIASFAMGKYEVTFAEWDACVIAGGCSYQPADEGWGRGKRPVINVSWDDINNQYIPWINRKTGKSYRLPSEAEWEYAARGGTTSAYWWGITITCSQAAYGGANCGATKTASVGQYQANSFGLFDVHGNVREWTEDFWHGNYAGAPLDGQDWVSGGNYGRRVLRGGAWDSDQASVRSAFRNWGRPSDRDTYGFRLAREL